MHKVLVVEDDDLLREIYCMKLEMEGFAVLAAEDGLKALELVSAHRPDLILLDMLMPRLDGLGFLTKYRDVPFEQRAIVVVASNKSSAQGMQEARALGAADYLIKAQLSPDDLAERVRQHLVARPSSGT